MAADFGSVARSADEPESPIEPGSIGSIAARLRSAAASPIAAERTAEVISAACAAWRDPDNQHRSGAIARIAANSGLSDTLLAESLDALLAPFSAQALKSFAAKVKRAPRLIGFVMPGNVAGAGMHELAQALIAGAVVVVKSASSEPVFFARFARTIAELDPEIAARVCVLTFGREQSDLTRALREACDEMVVFGDDETVDSLSRGGGSVIGFGSRVSGALISREAIAPESIDSASEGVARDITLFEQRGCLSPHHVFVECAARDDARRFARVLADALDELARKVLPPRAIDLGAAAAIRASRESSRWRKLAGAATDLWEGDRFAWTVIYDADVAFRVSPLYRTVFVTPVADFTHLRAKLEAMKGRLEAFAVADPAGRLERYRAWLSEAGVSYLAAPGMMQSPPFEWPHGNGAFLSRLITRT